MDPTEVSGHSLRAGLATAEASAGVQERVIAQTTGHKSMTVLRRYIREGNLFNENTAAAEVRSGSGQMIRCPSACRRASSPFSVMSRKTCGALTTGSALPPGPDA
jgi:hypothetical protein